jgi:AI-2 transport protein TqsA
MRAPGAPGTTEATGKVRDAGQSTGVQALLTMAAFVVVVAGMKAAQPLLVPFLLAIFLSVLSMPPLFWLQRRGMPSALAVLLIVLVLIGIGVFAGVVVGTQAEDFTRDLPAYQARLREQAFVVTQWLRGHDINVSNDLLREQFDPGAAIRLAGTLLSSFSAVLTNAFLILLTVVFILSEASGFPAKIRAAFNEPDRSLQQMGTIGMNINRYVAIKTMASLATGLVVAVWLAVLGVDYPLLWGTLAFLLNYVPNIGSIIAAVPGVLFALVQLGPGSAGLTALGYVAVNVGIGNFLEPRFQGQGVGLSTLVVFLSLVFWGWVLGPVGMLLSVPLTMALKIGLGNREDTRWLSVLLGRDAEGPPEPPPA